MTPNESGDAATNPKPGSGKTIPEMTWDEILALPSQPLSREEMQQQLRERIEEKRKDSQ
jgi:hypothetical protein